MSQSDIQPQLDAARFLVERHERIGEGLSARAGVMLGLTGVQFAVLTGVGGALPWAWIVLVDLLLLAAAVGFTWCLAARPLRMPTAEDLRTSVINGTDGTMVALEQLIGVRNKDHCLVEQLKQDGLRRAPGLVWGTRSFLAAQVALVAGLLWSQWNGAVL